MKCIDEDAGSSGLHPKHQLNSYQTKKLSASLDFLLALKQALKNDMGVYMEFMKAMQEFKAGSVTVPDLVAKVEFLLKDHHDFLLDFKAFIPQGCNVENIPEKPVDSDRILALVKKFKGQDENLYDRFLKIVINFEKGNRSSEEAITRVTDLWKNHPDLVKEFLCFLSRCPSKQFTSRVNMNTSQAEQTHMVEAKGELVEFKSSPDESNRRTDLHPLLSPAKSCGKKQEDRSIKSKHRQSVSARKLADQIRPTYIGQKREIFKGFDKSLKEKTHSYEQDRYAAVPIVNFLQRKLDFLRLVKSNFLEKGEFVEYLKCLALHSEGITTLDEFYMQVADIFSETPELLGGSMDLVRQCEAAELELLLSGKLKKSKRAFSQLAGKDELVRDYEQSKRSKKQPPRAWDANIEQRKEYTKLPLLNHTSPCTTGLGKDFESKKIPDYRYPCTTSAEHGNSKRHPSKETPYKESCHRDNNKSEEQENIKRRPSKENSQKFFHATSSNSVGHDNSKRHSCKENSHNKISHATSNKSTKQDSCKRHPSKENPHHATSSKSVEQDNNKGHPLKENSHNKSSHAISSISYLNRPLSKLDLSKCKQCTPSYRLLPDDYPLPIVGSQSVEGRAVLNDKWVSATSGSEDFKCMRKNEYEEILLQCEDDRADLDMLLEYTSSTVRGLEELLEVLSKQSEVVVDDHISARQQRLIELMYSDCGLEVLECLHQNAGLVTPVILKRVKHKQDEWLKYKAEMNKIWVHVTAKNYQKSLDHGSIQNKQDDTKNLSA